MKIKFSYILVLCFLSTSLFAQIDRSKMPEPGPAPEINLGEPDTFELGNGMEVMVVEDRKLPRVSVRLIIDNSPVLEKKPGVATLASALMGTGTTTMSKDEFNEEIEFLGANVNIGAGVITATQLPKVG